MHGTPYFVLNSICEPVVTFADFVEGEVFYCLIHVGLGVFDGALLFGLYDFDKAGQDASNALGRAMARLSNMYGIELDYNAIGLGYEQVVDWGLPTRDAKQGRSQWDYPFAAELDAIPVRQLRELVASYLSRHMSEYDLRKLALTEDRQRAQITMALSDSGLL